MSGDKVTLEELVVKLAVENQNLLTGLKESQKAFDDSMKRIGGHLEDLQKTAEKEMGGFQRVMETALGVFTGEAMFAAFSRVGHLMKDLATDGMKSAMATEDAINRLNTSMGLSGKYSDEASRGMVDFAQKLQQTTRFSDDAVLQSASLIEVLGRLDSQGLQRATQASADLAAALGMDLHTASMLVGKATEGNVSAFRRYGIAISEGNDEAQTFANTLRVIEQRFGGAAAQQAQTFAGKLEIMKHGWEDLTKTVMGAVIHNQAVKNVMDEITETIAELTEELERENQTLKELVAEGLISVIEGCEMVISALDGVVRAAQIVGNAIYGAFAEIGAAIAWVFSMVSDEAAEFQAAFEGEVIKSFENIGDAITRESWVDKLKGKLDEMKAAAREGFDEIAAGADAAAAPIVNAGNALDYFTQKQIETAQQGRDLAYQMIMDMEMDHELRTELLTMQYLKEQEMLTQAMEQQKITYGQYKMSLSLLDQKYINDKKTRDEKVRASELQNEMTFQKAKVDIFSATMGLIASVSASGSAAAFFAQKAAAAAQAFVAMNLAEAQALAVPPAPNLPLAALARTAGMINLAAIAGATIAGGTKFASGGTVPGIGFQDSAPAMLTPGEEVVNLSTSKKLRDFLDGQQGGGMGGELRVVFDFAGGIDRFIEVIETRMVERRRTGQTVLFA